MVPRAKGRGDIIKTSSTYYCWSRRKKLRRLSVGQKVDPRGLRIGIIKSWNSNWFAEENICKQFPWRFKD